MAGLIAVGVALACGDGAAPEPSEPTGLYQLQTVNGEGLPHVVAVYLDGSSDEIDQGALRVLSRGQLIVTATVLRRSAGGSLQRTTFDTVVFPYRRSGNHVVLSFQDPDGARSDTLELVDMGENSGLFSVSEHYRRPLRPITLVKGALYVK